MRYVAAYLLAVLGGNKAPTSEEIEKILSSVGIEADKERLTKVISELNGKNVQQIIDEGKTKLASVPSGGGVAVASAGGGAAEPAADKKEDKKKEEEKKKEESESDEDMGFGLFD